MLKNIYHKLISVLIIIIFLINYCTVLFSSNIVNHSYDDNEIGPVILPYDTMSVIGDSYAGLFIDFEDNRDFIITGYANAGHTIIENEDLMKAGMRSTDAIALISIGVNDHYRCTPLYVFEATMRRILDEGVWHKKVVMLHTYMNYPLSVLSYNQFTTAFYDDILTRLALDYPNVHYINLNDYQNYSFISSDNIHYNKDFYDILYKKVVNKLVSIAFLK